MRIAKLVLAALWFMQLGNAQTYDQCQQSCTNFYNVCAANADDQYGFCVQGCDKGCPGGTASLCTTNHDAAIAICDENYNNCLSDCASEVPPARASRRRLHRPQGHRAWALLMRNLSRPEKLKLTL